MSYQKKIYDPLNPHAHLKGEPPSNKGGIPPIKIGPTSGEISLIKGGINKATQKGSLIVPILPIPLEGFNFYSGSSVPKGSPRTLENISPKIKNPNQTETTKNSDGYHSTGKESTIKTRDFLESPRISPKDISNTNSNNEQNISKLQSPKIPSSPLISRGPSPALGSPISNNSPKKPESPKSPEILFSPRNMPSSPRINSFSPRIQNENILSPRGDIKSPRIYEKQTLPLLSPRNYEVNNTLKNNNQFSPLLEVHYYDGKIKQGIGKDIKVLYDEISILSFEEKKIKLEDFIITIKEKLSNNSQHNLDVIHKDFLISMANNFDSTNYIFAHDILCILSNIYFFIDEDSQKDLLVLLDTQFKDMDTGKCPSGRVSRLMQIVLCYTQT